MPVDPATPALSTMWAVQPRFERDLPAFLARAAELGFGAVEINHSMDAQQLRAVIDSGALPVTSVHAPAPLEATDAGVENRDRNLASLDEQERRLVLDFHHRTIDIAAEAGARFVVVHLGQVGDGATPGARRLRELYDRGERSGEAWEQAVRQARDERAEAAPPYLDAARRSLEALAEDASRAGVTLGLESRLSYHQIPLPREAVDLIAPYPPALVGYWHDVGHGEVLHRLGLVELASWFELLGDRLVGTHLHDMDGLLDHRAPGNGDVDFAWLAARIPPNVARTFEIDQREPDADVARGLVLLREAGVVA